MFGLSTSEIFILILLIIVGGEKAIKLLSLIPGFGPLAQAIEKLTKNGNGKKEDEAFNAFLTKLETNHLHDVAKQSLLGAVNGKLDVSAAQQDRLIDELGEIKRLLQDIKDKPC